MPNHPFAQTTTSIYLIPTSHAKPAQCHAQLAITHWSSPPKSPQRERHNSTMTTGLSNIYPLAAAHSLVLQCPEDCHRSHRLNNIDPKQAMQEINKI
jgi:hypothetical protein